MTTPSTERPGHARVATAVLLLAALVYAQYGLQGRLVRDDALYVYAGQQLAEGVSPYRSVFEHKGPLAPVLCGIAVAAGRVFGLDDLVAARLAFGLISSAVAAALFLLGVRLLGSQAAGLLVAAIFVCFWGFGRHAFSGPRAKTPFVLCEVLFFLFAARGRFGLAGLSASLAALTWQPGAVFAVLAPLLAVAQSGAPAARLRRGALALGGVALPLLLVCLWFALDGSFAAFLDGAVRFNLFFVGRNEAPWLERLQPVLAAVFDGFPWMWPLIGAGLLAIPLGLVACARRSALGLRGALLDGPGAAVFLSFPAPIAWSLIDFQNYPDFFVFLPYAALGAGGLLAWGIRRMARPSGFARANVLVASLALALALAGAAHYRTSAEAGVVRQREQAASLAAALRHGERVATIGVPQALVLLRQTNPGRHIVLFSGTDDYIEAREPGGFAGWLAELERAAPGAVAIDALAVPRRAQILRWLQRDYRLMRFGDWLVFLRQRP